MNTSSPIAWIMIGFIIVFTISMFIWLFNTKNKPMDNRNNQSHVVQKMINVIKDPFAEENKNLNELSQATKKLRDENNENNK